MAAAKLDPYAALGVDRDATAEDITAAFRREAKRSHPDAGGSAQEFNEVKRAHLVLVDPVKRARFDATGDIGDDGADNEDAGALELISGMLAQMLANDQDPFAHDLVSSMRLTLERSIVEITSKTAMLNRALKRADRMRGRFVRAKRKAEGNHIDGMLGWHTSQIKAQLSANGAAIARHNRAIELLRDYKFTPDPADEISLAGLRYFRFATGAATS